MNKDMETFEYTYSAQQQAEIERIRNKYLPKEDSPLEQLRKLDREVTQKGTIWSLVLGFVGTLIFGGGMSMCLLLGDAIVMVVIGVILGVVGAVVLGLAYPVYVKVTEKEKKRIAPRILELTEKMKTNM